MTKQNIMRNKYTLRVLWIDDKPNNDFVTSAAAKGIKITVRTNFDDGLESLEDRGNSFDAIILDANCVVTGELGELPEVSSLTYAINEINRRQIVLPWFVLSGEGFEGDNALKYLVPKNRPWDNRAFYRKRQDEALLLERIKSAVSDFEKTRIKQEYADACNLYQENDLVDLLVRFDVQDEDFDQDISVPNTIRCIMDWICHNFFSEVFEGSNISECSRLLGNWKLADIVPIYVQRSFHLLSEYCNAGSHRYQRSEGETPQAYRRNAAMAESLRSDISDGTAIYLNRLAVISLLTVLRWCSLLQEDKQALFKLQETIAALKK